MHWRPVLWQFDAAVLQHQVWFPLHKCWRKVNSCSVWILLNGYSMYIPGIVYQWYTGVYKGIQCILYTVFYTGVWREMWLMKRSTSLWRKIATSFLWRIGRLSLSNVRSLFETGQWHFSKWVHSQRWNQATVQTWRIRDVPNGRSYQARGWRRGYF